MPTKKVPGRPKGSKNKRRKIQATTTQSNDFMPNEILVIPFMRDSGKYETLKLSVDETTRLGEIIKQVCA